MFLALDIGNSNIKAGVFKNQEIVHHFTESNFHALLSSGSLNKNYCYKKIW